MHKWAKQIMECVKTKVDGMGMDNIDESQLCEFEKWTCIAKNIAEYDYYYNIVKAMEESGAEYGVDYDENGKFYTPMRNSRGRFMKGYEEPMHGKMYDERMDNFNHGKMHYQEPMHSESEYDRSKRMYTESKTMNPSDKSDHLTKLNKHIDSFKHDIMAEKDMMSNEEKQTAYSKLMNIANDIKQ